MYQYYFEKITVWQDAKDLVVMIYKVTQKFPKQEMYGLNSHCSGQRFPYQPIFPKEVPEALRKIRQTSRRWLMPV